MKVGEDVFTAGDAGPWGTVMAVQFNHGIPIAIFINPIFSSGGLLGPTFAVESTVFSMWRLCSAHTVKFHWPGYVPQCYINRK